ncbi:replication protein A 70 kDa DNA-binding subunit B-like [Coffea arabica]
MYQTKSIPVLSYYRVSLTRLLLLIVYINQFYFNRYILLTRRDYQTASCAFESLLFDLSSIDMEKKCVLIPELTDTNSNWFAKLIVIEKSAIRYSKEDGRPYQKLVFADAMRNTIQATIFERDIQDIEPILQLYSTYYIGNAWITKISIPFYLASSPYQMTISKRTFIQAVSAQDALPSDYCYELTSFTQLHNYIGDYSARINILCAVVHALPPRLVPRGKRYVPIQEFAVVNEEKQPMTFTMWEEFLSVEGSQLKAMVPQQPIILLARPKVNSYHTISLGTQATTIILFNPEIPQATALRNW